MLAVGAGDGFMDVLLLFILSLLSGIKTAQYRLKLCLKGSLNQKQTTNSSCPNKIRLLHSFSG